ncbi:MAG: serine hydrolase [Thermoanaerobaculia bacterium]|nr:serine hydrolase [Thermoanaerobaculia bacterium]
MRRAQIVSILALAWALTLSALASDRVPEDHWLSYSDPREAGFDPARLAEAEAQWSDLPSSAFMVIADGAVVANWGETERRFMCHSVRKSFLSGLFGIYWDRGEIELNKTVGEIGIDEEDGLLDSEKQARVLDLLKARSGVFHPAAYAGRTDSRPRGSEGPGRYFAYNNWDFNTLAAILEKETGNTVFEAFDEHFGQPLQMEDWRLADGYFHYERDKSVYPAYPFRLSARDAARFGLLYARDGAWGEQRILSRHWVRRSTALYSIDNDVFGYGFMWWIAREPRFERYGMAAALGVGNQMIAIFPDIDLVIVNRANTYHGETTPQSELLDLVEKILQARTGVPTAQPRLVPLPEAAPDSRLRPAVPESLDELVGVFPYPPNSLGLPEATTVSVKREGDHLVTFSEVSGTFNTYLQPDGWLVEEDSFERYLPLRNEDGEMAGLVDSETLARSALLAAAAGDSVSAARRLELIEGEEGLSLAIYRIVIQLITDPTSAENAARQLMDSEDSREVEAQFNGAGYQMLYGPPNTARPELAQSVFELNTRLFPGSFNAWDSLAEAHMVQGHRDEAVRFYRKSLELNPDNRNATTKIEEITADETGSEAQSRNE